MSYDIDTIYSVKSMLTKAYYTPDFTMSLVGYINQSLLEFVNGIKSFEYVDSTKTIDIIGNSRAKPDKITTTVATAMDNFLTAEYKKPACQKLFINISEEGYENLQEIIRRRQSNFPFSFNLLSFSNLSTTENNIIRVHLL